MKGSVAAYGEALVFEQGLAALGYPPTWVLTVAETKKVQLRIKAFFELNPDVRDRLSGYEVKEKAS